MKRRVITLALAASLAVGSFALTSAPVRAGLGDLLKGGAMVLAVEQFGDQINNFINKITLNKGVGVEDRTKVVPIVSLGQGKYIGAVQVSGPAHLVEKVKAVAQIETDFKSFRIKALVPVESTDVVKDLKRVSGVGISALVDTSIRL